MSTPTKSEYMLLFRGTDWHKGLSPQEIQQVVNQMKAWFDRLTAEGKAKAGKPLFHEGKIVSQKRGLSVSDGPFAESKLLVASFYLRWEAWTRPRRLPRTFQAWSTALRSRSGLLRLSAWWATRASARAHSIPDGAIGKKSPS